MSCNGFRAELHSAGPEDLRALSQGLRKPYQRVGTICAADSGRRARGVAKIPRTVKPLYDEGGAAVVEVRSGIFWMKGSGL